MRPAYKALAVTLFALLMIWLLAPRWPVATWLLASFVAVLLLHHTSTLEDVGLGWSTFVTALQAWKWVYILCALVFAVLAARHPITRATILGAIAYFAECVVQQLIYQHLVCAPLAADPATSRRSLWIAASLFAVVHLPNPVLAPATFAWGLAACLLFRQRRSLWAVALFQYLLSGIVYALVPYVLHHAFRIGPRYFSP